MGKLVEQRNKELEQENQKLKQMLKKVTDDGREFLELVTGVTILEEET